MTMMLMGEEVTYDENLIRIRGLLATGPKNHSVSYGVGGLDQTVAFGIYDEDEYERDRDGYYALPEPFLIEVGQMPTVLVVEKELLLLLEQYGIRSNHMKGPIQTLIVNNTECFAFIDDEGGLKDQLTNALFLLFEQWAAVHYPVDGASLPDAATVSQFLRLWNYWSEMYELHERRDWLLWTAIEMLHHHEMAKQVCQEEEWAKDMIARGWRSVPYS